ncbi:MAG: nucleoside-diphosphate kinase [Candidatus Nanoarchaeia archaeon]|nr:nucleoside-diphosphate kinase [Candidatus Nanoarchaeia archaeon]
MNSNVERTLVLLKPDCVKRMYVGEIITRFERVGFKIVAMKMVVKSADFFEKHYYDVEQRHGREILDGNLKTMTSGPVIAMILEGVDSIEGVRKIVGPTEPRNAPPGTIRGDYSHYTYARADSNKVAVRNIIHASANLKDAEYEINLWFTPEEIFEYKTVHDVFILE